MQYLRMCIIEQVHLPVWDATFMKHYSFILWIIGLSALIYWALELLIIRNVFRCSAKRIKKLNGCELKLPIAYLIIFCSLTASFISSSLFLHSSSAPSHITCSYSPIIAILFRFISKHFIWAFNIVRGQMVIESLEHKSLSIFVQHSPYILTTQMLIIFCIVFVFSSSFYDKSVDECATQIPLALIICIAFIGEVLYGIGFVYIFCKAMTDSMKRVITALRISDTQKTKKQLIHHLIVYLIQFLLSSLYIISIATCSNANIFTTFDIFQAELLISNICLLTLFRGRSRWCKKHCHCDRNQHERKLSMYSIPRRTSNEYTNHQSTPLPVAINTNDAANTNQVITPETDSVVEIPAISNREKPLRLRHNSISMNPLLPDSWLSTDYLQTLRVSLVNKHKYPCVIGMRSQSDPICNVACGEDNESDEKTKNEQVKSWSLSLINVQSKTNEEQKSNSFTTSIASAIFSLGSHSTPFRLNCSDDLASVEPITAIVSVRDEFKSRSTPFQQEHLYEDST